MKGTHTAVKRVGELGKPGSPGHVVEFEVTISRRKIFRMVLPFLVASMGFAGEKVSRDDTHDQLDDGSRG